MARAGATLTPAQTGRLAGWLLAAGGAAGLTVVALPLPPGVDVAGAVWLSVASLLVAAVVLAVPWGRWGPGTQLVALALPVAGLLVGRDLSYGPHNEIRAVYFAVVAAWVGLSQRHLTILAVCPLLAGCYLGPIVAEGQPVVPHLGFLVQALLACVALAECLAWLADRLRRAEQAAARHLGAMESLLGASTTLAHDLEPGQAPATVADAARDLLGADTAQVYLADAGQLEPGRAEVPAGARRCFAEGRIVVADEAGGRRFFLPLRGTAGALGVIELYAAGAGDVDAFTRHLSETFTIQAGLALERTLHRAELVDSSRRDELTGLANRRGARRVLDALQGGEAVVMVDLDHFKAVNDAGGHAAGDALLREFAAFLVETLGEAAFVARLGGEEFLVVLATGPAAPEGVIDAARRRWLARRPPATFSAGVAVHRAGRPASATFEAADAALYEAKRAGRNGVRGAVRAPETVPVAG